MIPAITAHSTPHPGKCRAGFTLIEVIVALVVAGILASIAAMGIVSAINGFVMIRENVALSQKIQLAAARINRELLELTDITDRGDTPPYIVYESATGERRAIAEVGGTVRLYDDPEKIISSSYLENNGDILTDRVDSFSLHYFQGSAEWEIGDDIRALSTIAFSIHLLRKDLAGSTVNLSARVYLRNNDNYGGAAALPTAPPTSDQYACFIATMQGHPTDPDACRGQGTLGWNLGLIIAVAAGLHRGRRTTTAKSKTRFKPRDNGSALIGVVITIMVFAALGAAIIPMISSSALHRSIAGRSAQAYYLAESGLRYASSQYLHAGGQAAQYTVLDDLHGVVHHLQGHPETFTLSFNPYYFTLDKNHTTTPTLTTHIYGELASGYTIPDGGGLLSIDGTPYRFTAAQINAQQITFSLAASLTAAKDTPVYPVALALAGQEVEDGGTLLLSPGSGAMFPDGNGAFVLDGITYTYREYNPDTNRLSRIRRADRLAFAAFSLTADAFIRLKKFVKITSTGVVGSGDLAAARDIVYHVQIPEEKTTQRLTFHETFDDLDKWNPSVSGKHEITTVEGNPVLRVTGVAQADTSAASLISLNPDAFQFNPDNFDAQVKIGYLESMAPPAHGYHPLPVPWYYAAGLCFRLSADGNTYGLSLQRGSNALASDDQIDNNLIPLDDVSAIVLWQATNNGADKTWLAYKRIADRPLDASSQNITPDQWSVDQDEMVSDPITDLTTIPVLPCDYQMIKLKLSTRCDPAAADCTTLAVTINGGTDWLPVQEGAVDLTAFAGQPINDLRFRINAGTAGWQLSDLAFVADRFTVQNATLLVRFKQSASIAFDTGGPDRITPGDRVIGLSSNATATVYGPPALLSDAWNASPPAAAGTLLVENINGAFQINERLAVAGKSELATITGYRSRDHFIKAYVGTEQACGTPNADALDAKKHANPINPPALQWPPDEGDAWTSETDFFQLIQWDAINSDVGTIDIVATIDAPNTLVRSSETGLMGNGSILGLHTFGEGSLNIYFDDFGYQSFVNQPVIIAQPLQY